jgi:hypothetical protein
MNAYEELKGWGLASKPSDVKDLGVELVERHVNVTLGGVKYDGEKSPLHLIPTECLEEIAKVLSVGSRKYSDWNWAKGFKWSRLYSSTLRHLFAHMRGESKDPETGVSHLAHCACNVLFLMYHEMHGVGEDDRHPRPSASSK